jgi:hypothetical protein
MLLSDPLEVAEFDDAEMDAVVVAAASMEAIWP